MFSKQRSTTTKGESFRELVVRTSYSHRTHTEETLTETEDRVITPQRVVK